MGHRTSIDLTAEQPGYWPGVLRAPQNQPEPEGPGTAGKALFVVLFWASLATSLLLWWLNTPAHTLATPGDVLVGVGRITGMIGGLVLLTQVLLMSRVGWLERWMGSDALLVWHRELGGHVVLTVLAHVGVIVVRTALG